MSEWRFFLDENIDPKVATYLEKEGPLAEHVRDTLGQGADDEDDVLPCGGGLNGDDPKRFPAGPWRRGMASSTPVVASSTYSTCSRTQSSI